MINYALIYSLQLKIIWNNFSEFETLLNILLKAITKSKNQDNKSLRFIKTQIIYVILKCSETYIPGTNSIRQITLIAN